MSAKPVVLIERIPVDRCHLYGLKSPHAMAKRLGWELKKLRELAENGEYRVFNHPQTGREIQEPNAALQSLHRQIHRYLARIEAPDYLHSALKGRSYLTNAKAHIGAGSLIKIDIAKFYQSVPQHKVMHFFRDTMNCSPDVAGLIANLICYRGKLATGSAASPIVSYYAFKPLFDDLAALAERHGLRMTCYVDDITMSGPGASNSVLHEARTTIFRAGLRAHKDHRFAPHEAKIVTGVIVGSVGVALPFSRWQKIRLATRHLNRSLSREDRLKLYPSLVSRLYEATQIEPRCRIPAEFYHREWRASKTKVTATVTLPESIAA